MAATAVSTGDEGAPPASPPVVGIAAAAPPPARGDDADALARACSVYCGGPLLHAVQSAALFDDSKTFVDMPMRDEPEAVLAAFAALPAPVRAGRDRRYGVGLGQALSLRCCCA